ncbi:MAG: site-2 protease family protein [Anaerolineales bacterium]
MDNQRQLKNHRQDGRETVQDEVLTRITQRVMDIEQTLWGRSNDKYLVRYQGRLLKPSSEAYDQLSQAVKSYQVTPVFREENGKHAIYLRKGLFEGKESKSWINILLFVATFLSMVFAGLITSYAGPLTSNLSVVWAHLKPELGGALAFTFSLLGILTAHEFGHYFMARYHKTKVTLPYFIPFPISPFGTMGAFISLQEPPKNKRSLLDIGIAGPLAGLVIAIPVLIYGLSLSPVEPLPQPLPSGEFFFEGNSILYLLLKYVVHGQWLPDPASYQGLNPIWYWIRYFFTGLPLPKGGVDVSIHPVAWAGWAGLLVTALNLLPAGQLDGGHLVYGLLGDKAKKLWPFILGIIFVLGFFWSGWWLWAFLILIFGRTQAEPLDQITKLDPKRKILARFGLIIFILIFTPVPLVSV